MKCPFCEHEDTQVKDSRSSDDGLCIRRRRECPECGRRFTTFERFQVQQLVVVKKDGRREIFEEDKLLRSLMTALRKRPFTRDDVAKIVSEIEQSFIEKGKTEISSAKLGDAILNKLKEVDFVGYIRYVSVYKGFNNPTDFINLMEEMANK